MELPYHYRQPQRKICEKPETNVYVSKYQVYGVCESVGQKRFDTGIMCRKGRTERSMIVGRTIMRIGTGNIGNYGTEYYLGI
jgi:hypothetical protein